MFSNFQALYQTLYSNGYYHTAIVFEREHRLFKSIWSEKEADEQLVKDSKELSSLSSDSLSLCTSCRSNVETSQKSCSSRPLQEKLKRDNNTLRATHRICKKCSHHTSLMDPQSTFIHQKNFTCSEKQGNGQKAGHRRSSYPGRQFKSKSYPAETTFREAEKRLLERVNRWNSTSERTLSTLPGAIEHNEAVRFSFQNDEEKNPTKASLVEQEGNTTICSPNMDTCDGMNKSDSSQRFHFFMGPYSKTEQCSKESRDHCHIIPSLQNGDSISNDSLLIASPLLYSSISPLHQQLSTDNYESNVFVDTFSNIFDDFFSLQTNDKD